MDNGSGWTWVIALIVLVFLIRLAAGGQLIQLYDYITTPTITSPTSASSASTTAV